MALRMPRLAMIGRVPWCAALACLAAVLIGRLRSACVAQTDFFQFEQRPAKQRAPKAQGRRRGQGRQADAGAGDRGSVRPRQRARERGRQRADLLRRLDPRSRQGRLRSEDQAAARRRQCAADRAGRQHHLRRNPRTQRRLPRRLRQFAAARNARSDAIRRRARRPQPTAATRCSRAASTPPASRARTIRASRRSGRSRPRASSTTKQEKMIYFERRSLEFFGTPIAYFPYFSTPDPTVKRKTGWLMPIFSTDAAIYGFAVEVPYFWALAPNYDLTLTPSIIDQAGSVAAGRVPSPADERRLCDPRRRHLPARQGRVHSHQRPADAGLPRLARRIEIERPVRPQRRWIWGWDGAADLGQDLLPGLSRPDLHQRRAQSVRQHQQMEGVSQLYLVGRGDRSYFDARTIYYYGFSEFDDQKQIADHPSGDRLQLRRRTADPRRRTELPLQPDQPVARHRRLRSDQSDRGEQRTIALRPRRIPRSRTPTIACCAARPAPTRACPPRRTGRSRSSTRSARCSRRSSRCAPMWRR